MPHPNCYQMLPPMCADGGIKTFLTTVCPKHVFHRLKYISIYTLSDLGVLSNLIGSLSLANEHYSPPTE